MNSQKTKAQRRAECLRNERRNKERKMKTEARSEYGEEYTIIYQWKHRFHKAYHVARPDDDGGWVTPDGSYLSHNWKESKA